MLLLDVGSVRDRDYGALLGRSDVGRVRDRDYGALLGRSDVGRSQVVRRLRIGKSHRPTPVRVETRMSYQILFVLSIFYLILACIGSTHLNFARMLP